MEEPNWLAIRRVAWIHWALAVAEELGATAARRARTTTEVGLEENPDAEGTSTLAGLPRLDGAGLGYMMVQLASFIGQRG